MDLLGIATEIENKLKEKKLVDRRLGSGFCFIDNSRDVQLEYPKAVRDYFSQLEETIAEITKNNPEVDVAFRYRSDNFSFYVNVSYLQFHFENYQTILIFYPYERQMN